MDERIDAKVKPLINKIESVLEGMKRVFKLLGIDAKRNVYE